MGTLLIFPHQCVYLHERPSFQRPENNQKANLSLFFFHSSSPPLHHSFCPCTASRRPLDLTAPSLRALPPMTSFVHAPTNFCHEASTPDSSVISRQKLNSSQLQAQDLPQGRTPFNSCFPEEATTGVAVNHGLTAVGSIPSGPIGSIGIEGGRVLHCSSPHLLGSHG